MAETLPVSQLLLNLCRRYRDTTPTVREILDDLGDRGLGVTLLVLSVISLVPGIGMLAGVVICLPAWEMITRKTRLQLPERFERRRLELDGFERLVNRSVPFLRFCERLVRARGEWMFSPLAMRLLGGLVLLFGISISLPVPLSNLIPAFGLFFLALGMMEHDGWVCLAGAIIGAGGLIVTVYVIDVALELLGRFLMI